MKELTQGLIAIACLVHSGQAMAQPKAAACFFSTDFESSEALLGWDLGADVQRRTPEGEDLGIFVPAWILGNAADANADGYFPVTDSPIGNRFAMANDAAEPCNCDMADVRLTSPVIDLSGRTGVALECRVFNENTFGSGPSVIEVSTVDGEWSTLITLADVQDQWQSVFADLTAFDGAANFRFRFRWSDGGAWAGGFAVDDICLRGRTATDLVVSDAQLGVSNASIFETGDQRLVYRQLPFSQVAPVTVSATVKNGGTAVLNEVRVSAIIRLNDTDHGPFLSDTIDALLPGETRIMDIATGWQPDAPGTATITITGSTAQGDDAPEDDSAAGTVQFTADGWDNGYSAMSCDRGAATGSVGGSGGFIISNRMEIVSTGDQAEGISVAYGTGTQSGAVIRAVLMDANFSTIDTSARRTLQQADIDAIWNGLPLFEAFATRPTLEPGDYHVGIQQLTSGGDQPMHVSVAGSSSAGRSVIQEGIGFTLSYLYTTPMVRLHLAAVPVGVDEQEVGTLSLRVFPNPANDVVRVHVPEENASGEWKLVDVSGRAVRAGKLQGAFTSIDLTDQPIGTYVIVVTTGNFVGSAPVVVAH